MLNSMSMSIWLHRVKDSEAKYFGFTMREYLLWSSQKSLQFDQLCRRWDIVGAIRRRIRRLEKGTRSVMCVRNHSRCLFWFTRFFFHLDDDHPFKRRRMPYRHFGRESKYQNGCRIKACRIHGNSRCVNLWQVHFLSFSPDSFCSLETGLALSQLIVSQDTQINLRQISFSRLFCKRRVLMTLSV